MGFSYSLVVESQGEVILMGDFNEVRFVSERFGTQFCAGDAAIFNQFIADADLVDLPLGGPSYTWANKLGSKMSKLDRFLLSPGLLDSLPRLSALVLEKKVPYHRPILLREQKLDYGAYPFRVFHSWFLFPGFDDLVKSVWMQHDDFGSHPMTRFKKKLQLLKSKIRVWIAERRYMTTSRRAILQKDIDEIDGMIWKVRLLMRI